MYLCISILFNTARAAEPQLSQDNHFICNHMHCIVAMTLAALWLMERTGSCYHYIIKETKIQQIKQSTKYVYKHFWVKKGMLTKSTLITPSSHPFLKIPNKQIALLTPVIIPNILPNLPLCNLFQRSFGIACQALCLLFPCVLRTLCFLRDCARLCFSASRRIANLRIGLSFGRWRLTAWFL
jgi:hypothetical protein